MARNLFAQYSQPENQLTHALISVLAWEPALARSFVAWATTWQIPASSEIAIEQQHVPGQRRAVEEGERRSVPDAVLWSGEAWCLVVEAKIGLQLTIDQIKRHHRMVSHSFDQVIVLAITPDAAPADLPTWARHRTWIEVYAWMGEQRSVSKRWADQYREFARLLETALLNNEETYAVRQPLTVFDGIPFNEEHPYGAREARHLIRQVMDGLRKHPKIQALGVSPTSTGRPAITGRGDDPVWDFLPVWPSTGDDAFTKWPHLTVGIDAVRTSIGLTIPNGVHSGIRSRLAGMAKDQFVEVIREFNKVISAVSPEPGIQPIAVVVQRHYLGQKVAINDVDLHIDLRAITGGEDGKIKENPLWIDALYQSLTARSGANVQVEIGTHFLTKHGVLAKANAINLLAEAFAACGPLIQLLRVELVYKT
jgi:hypothetical protein